MDKSQRQIELRRYMHDVHSRVGDPGWHRETGTDWVFWSALILGVVAFVILSLWVRA